MLLLELVEGVWVGMGGGCTGCEGGGYEGGEGEEGEEGRGRGLHFAVRWIYADSCHVAGSVCCDASSLLL